MNEIVLKAVLKIIHTHYDTLSTRAIIISSISYEYLQDSCLASVWQAFGKCLALMSEFAVVRYQYGFCKT